MTCREGTIEMQQLRGFAPWIAYGAIASALDRRAGAAVALVLAVRIAHDARRGGEADDLGRTSAWFFGALTVVSMTMPTSPLQHYTAPLSLAALGAAAMTSIARGRPFTIPFAKRRVAPELWDTPMFHAANVTISAVWTASFLVTAATSALVIANGTHAGALLLAVQALGVIVPIRFTMSYRARLRRRLATVAA
jgi:hypothetical protein